MSFNKAPTRPHKVDDRLVDTKRSTPKEFAGIPDMDCRFVPSVSTVSLCLLQTVLLLILTPSNSLTIIVRSKKLYVCGARSYGQEATGGHSGLTDDVSLTI